MLELRRRGEQFLELLGEGEPLPFLLWNLRTVEVPERISTSKGREILCSVAKESPEARLTQEAKSSLQRVASAAP